MKRFLGMTVIGLMSIVNSTYATPLEYVAPELHLEQQQSPIQESIVTEAMDKEVLETFKANFEGEEGEVTFITTDDAIVREKASADANILYFFDDKTPVFVKERVGNWYLVKTTEQEGYVYKQQLDETPLSEIPDTKIEEAVVEQVKEVEQAQKAETQVQVTRSLGEQIVAKAKTYLGNPYVYGGTSLTRGTDCSGFTQQIMKQFGISLERTSRSQYASNGYKVSRSNILPGDLVFYGYGGSVSHVAIYAGNNQIIHASTTRTGICMGSIDCGMPIVGIKRVVR